MMTHVRSMEMFWHIVNRQKLRYVARIAKNHCEVLAARRLHAKEFIRRGFLTEDDIDDTGCIRASRDEYHRHSIYYVVENASNQQIVGASRQILGTPEKGYFSFQVMKHVDLFPKALATVKSRQLTEICELSGVVKERGQPTIVPLLLYRTMWHQSLLMGHELWLMLINDKAYQPIQKLFGRMLIRVGPPLMYWSTRVYPCTVRTSQALDALIEESRSAGSAIEQYRARLLVRFMIDGLDLELLGPATRRELALLHGRRVAARCSSC